MRGRPARGDHVTIVRDGVLHPAWVMKPGREVRVRYVVETPDVEVPGFSSNLRYYTRTEHNYHLRPRDEGNTWARGWDGEAVEALRAAVALA